MRESNFSIPNVNKASVGITTALYDRRALDCTSTLPLINSLNHLAYLTTSSARIRDILTVDGGIERLISILKQGRSKDMMGLWKWNLAFQCVVNIGVRGTENVRTRVVEADMVPVIATILDNYIKIIQLQREKTHNVKEKCLSDYRERHRHRHHTSTSSRTANHEDEERATRRHNHHPHSIDTNITRAGPSTAPAQQESEITALNSDDGGQTPLARPSFLATLSEGRSGPTTSQSQNSLLAVPGPASQLPRNANMDGVIRPIRDLDRLAAVTPLGPNDITSQPTSPTTPIQPPQLRSPPIRAANSNAATPARAHRRPSIRHQNSTTASEDINADSVTSDEAPDTEMTGNADMQSAVGIQDITMEDDSILADASLELTTPTVSERPEDSGAFNISHRNTLDGSVGNTTPTPVAQMALSPNRPAMPTPTQPSLPNSSVPRYLLDRNPASNDLSAVMPREEDVLMSLQLLAYVSKYCGLRTYFQKSHLVPRLNINKELAQAKGEEYEEVDEDELDDQEYLLPNDFNLFPLVEKFTVRHHSTDMQYWAGVVMRNLCRKDDTRGGIRQCAYYQCGKWEEFTRQFAKCRRCRRTKYCSKECQKSAWAFHRHWCVAAS